MKYNSGEVTREKRQKQQLEKMIPAGETMHV